MLRSAAKLIGYRVSALDGEVGRCRDILLEDGQWRARYLVAETGAWLSARQVPISPLELRKADWTSRRLVLEGQREQLRHRLSPETLSASMEAQLEPREAPEGAEPEPANDDGPGESPRTSNAGTRPSLGSLGELLGCKLVAEGRNLGICEDVIVDDDTWSCPYLVIDNQDWLSGQKTLLPSDWIDSIDREGKVLLSSRSAGEIEACPEYDPRAPGCASAEALTGVRSVDAPRPGWGLGQTGTAAGAHGLRAALARIILG